MHSFHRIFETTTQTQVSELVEGNKSYQVCGWWRWELWTGLSLIPHGVYLAAVWQICHRHRTLTINATTDKTQSHGICAHLNSQVSGRSWWRYSFWRRKADISPIVAKSGFQTHQEYIAREDAKCTQVWNGSETGEATPWTPEYSDFLFSDVIECLG